MNDLREVSKEEFFAIIGKLNVHPTPIGKYPYTSIWKTPEGTEKGRTVDEVGSNGLAESKYYLRES